ncbi:hypothetical protein E2562_026726 [Oryza meyeriana var. granulata]|uniref:Uncharacterized protein n=1 Tax=Oryza meyeriana var. granulata TaxID=110450 RepID=A0A6G1EZ41_9ORYZ|nr:hypothetical protein E2562_026726 [Oryza meyeriana var. granulata]
MGLTQTSVPRGNDADSGMHDGFPFTGTVDDSGRCNHDELELKKPQHNFNRGLREISPILFPILVISQ